MWIPFTFTPVMLGGGGGQIESGKISIWRKIGFKINQILALCQALFISVRTLEYVKCGDAGFLGVKGSKDVNVNVDVDLNWDFVPIMLILMEAYLALNAIAYVTFDVGRELNAKVFNEFIRLWGKTRPYIQESSHFG